MQFRNKSLHESILNNPKGLYRGNGICYNNAIRKEIPKMTDIIKRQTS